MGPKTYYRDLGPDQIDKNRFSLKPNSLCVKSPESAHKSPEIFSKLFEVTIVSIPLVAPLVPLFVPSSFLGIMMLGQTSESMVQRVEGKQQRLRKAWKTFLETCVRSQGFFTQREFGFRLNLFLSI